MGWRLPTVLILVLLVGAVAEARGRSGELWRRDYPDIATKHRDWVHRRVRQILAPTMTFPALGRAGGKISLLVKVRKGNHLKRLAGDKPDGWAVTLRAAGGGGAHQCKVTEVHDVKVGAELTVVVPVDLARDVYDLTVVGPGVDDSQPNAVRIHGAKRPERYRLAVITDHQLWDPTFKLKGRALGPGDFPKAKGAADNLAMANQTFAELALWDPEFILHLGDLVFGVNYPEEYKQAYEVLDRAGLPIFAVPGNHDAYADYVVRLRGGALKVVAGALGCRKHLKGDLSWNKAWVFITCVYGDVKEMLYADLHRDGLVFWRRQLGPTAYAFDHGGIHFVGINTYDGTPERRHAFSIYMDVFDLHLGAPAVDNYGGYLTEEQLRFIEAQAKLAKERGQTLVVFGHHDPRGSSSGKRYHPNEPFPTDPISMAGFEQWNFDSKEWDSDPEDRRSAETEHKNSAHALLRILAEHGGYYLSGHVHHDGRRVYEPGAEIVKGITAKRRLEFIATTTASAGVREDGYWGYRLIEVDGQTLKTVDYSPQHHLSSVPGGNLWASFDDTKPHFEVELVSGLPRPASPLVRWELPSRVEGYRFRLSAAGLPEGTVPSRLTHPRVEQVMWGEKHTTYWVRATLPAAKTYDRRLRRRIKALAARGNRPPEGVVDVGGAGGLNLQPMRERYDGAPGQPLLLSAVRSSDPDGDRIVAYLWRLGEKRQARGPRVVHRFTEAGVHKVTLTLIDEAGARSSVEGEINLQPPRPRPPPPPPGCGCCASGVGTVAVVPPGLLLIALLLVRRWRRRSKE
jgi:hypothetical protein